MSQAPTKATFITFYSYKGGVGRSMALINTAAMLAGRGLGVVRQGFRVLVLDLDLEAPGLSYLVNSEADSSQPGFVDLLIDAKERGVEADLFALPIEEVVRRYTRPYRFLDDTEGTADGKLDIMPAGRSDGNYIRRFADLNLPELYKKGLGEPLIRVFKTKLAEAGLYDYVLVDNRTGFSDEAGICTRDLADFLIIVSGLNRQNVEGTCDFLRALRDATGDEPQRHKSIRIVLSPVPNGEDDLLDRRENEAKIAFEAAWGTDVDVSLQIPYHPKLALTEEPHISRRRRGALFEAYREITRYVLRSIGHDTPSLTRTIATATQSKEYVAAIFSLAILLQLEDGESAVEEIAGELVTWDDRAQQQNVMAKARPQLDTLKTIASDENGRRLLELLVSHLPVEGFGWQTRQMIERLDGPLPAVIDALFDRLPANSPNTAILLSRHAVALETRLRNDERAKQYYLRAVNAAPMFADHLLNYAIFLDRRGEHDGARAYYERAIAADPNHANNLGAYAIFLHRRGEHDMARTHFKRAIAADPNHAYSLGGYALFLDRRGEHGEARAFYERAIAADPNHANNLGNYGQFLVGQGEFEEGSRYLLDAIRRFDQPEAENRSETYFALWVTSRILKRDAGRWEQGFKFEVLRGFERTPWEFDRMLQRAMPLLSPNKFAYAKAMAAAFLDEARVADLESFPRWRDLEPLDPIAEGQPPLNSEVDLDR